MKERITIRLETELLTKINIIAEAKNRSAEIDFIRLAFEAV